MNAQIGTVSGLGVPPTPFTLKFSSKEGLQALPDLPATFMSHTSYTGLPQPSGGGRVYIRRSAQISEPELSPRTLMRKRLKETVRVNRELATEAGPHLARRMWQGIDMEEDRRAKEGRLDDRETRMSREMSLGATWGGVACKETAEMTIAVAGHSQSVNTLFNMTPKNLLRLPSRPRSSMERRATSSSVSASRSSLSVLSSAASSTVTVPLNGPHPDPRPGFQVEEGRSGAPMLGSWNRHVASSDIRVSGSHVNSRAPLARQSRFGYHPSPLWQSLSCTDLAAHGHADLALARQVANTARSQEPILLHPGALGGTSSSPKRRVQVSTRLQWGTMKRVPLADRVQAREENETDMAQVRTEMLRPLQTVVRCPCPKTLMFLHSL